MPWLCSKNVWAAARTTENIVENNIERNYCWLLVQERSDDEFKELQSCSVEVCAL